MIKPLLTAIACLLGMLTIACVGGVTREVEPNDSLTEPQVIDVPETIAGVASAGDLDLYFLPPALATAVEVDISGLGASGQIAVMTGDNRRLLAVAEGDSKTIFLPLGEGAIIYLGNEEVTETDYLLSVTFAER